jgi:hypothetical protein
MKSFSPALETSKAAEMKTGEFSIIQIDDEVKIVGEDRL